MHTRKVPSTGEALPVIGMGSWRTFDAPMTEAHVEVVRTLLDGGGRLIDSSPMYGRSETTIGEVLEKLRRPAFVATKVWTSGREDGIEQMRASIRKLGGKVDLMQIHNLVDWRTHAKTLREWKEQGVIRYWGITHYSLSALDEMERIVRAEKPDFVQLPYSAGVRDAEERLLPACAEQGAAVLVMRPFEAGALVAREKPVPAWAREELDCESWPQLLLKFILGHPAVTCPIPATANPEHMSDDLRAGEGRLPDESQRARIVAELRA